MIPSPIVKVLSSIQKNHVQALLMGGQACVLYGAAEFSRDVDLAVLQSEDNVSRIEGALKELQAEVIAVPPFHINYLERGHAVHFRCRAPEAFALRVDIMSRMRGVGGFQELWQRRTTMDLPEEVSIEVLSLPDLVAAKKTQRDKDWPMLAGLVETSYFQHRRLPSEEQIAFWFAELRTPSIIIELSRQFPDRCREAAIKRPLLRHSLEGDIETLSEALKSEEQSERLADREYWAPLKRELEELRRSIRRKTD